MRYAELVQEGKNPEAHNFLADWIPYWGRRVKELAGMDIHIKRKQLRIQFRLGKKRLVFSVSDPEPDPGGSGIKLPDWIRIRNPDPESEIEL